MKFFVGTSGYQYKHWNDGRFYPPEVRDQLKFIYEKLNVVEINASHYSIPKPETVSNWADKVPEGSKLILKCPRSVSHRRRLMLESDNPEVRPGLELLEYFIEGYQQIPHEKQGPVLVQINDRQVINLDRLEDMLRMLSYYDLRCAFEARHESWFTDETFALLRKYNSALVAHDWTKYKCPLVVTADFVYFRNHGPKQMYTGSYTDEMLQAELELIGNQSVDEAYVLFNNDGHAYAPKNAIQMLEMINEQGLEQAVDAGRVREGEGVL